MGFFYSYTLCSVSLFHLPLFRVSGHGVHHYSYFRPWEQRVTEDIYSVVNRLYVAGAESHAGQIFCQVGALALTGSLHHVDEDLFGWGLCERQVQSGGLNGLPGKPPDDCYSW